MSPSTRSPSCAERTLQSWNPPSSPPPSLSWRPPISSSSSRWRSASQACCCIAAIRSRTSWRGLERGASMPCAWARSSRSCTPPSPSGCTGIRCSRGGPRSPCSGRLSSSGDGCRGATAICCCCSFRRCGRSSPSIASTIFCSRQGRPWRSSVSRPWPLRQHSSRSIERRDRASRCGWRCRWVSGDCIISITPFSGREGSGTRGATTSTSPSSWPWAWGFSFSSSRTSVRVCEPCRH